MGFGVGGGDIETDSEGVGLRDLVLSGEFVDVSVALIVLVLVGDIVFIGFPVAAGKAETT
jgi:hypothetical protein